MSTQTIAQSKPRSLSPVVALLWEEWRQTRIPLLGGAAVGILAMAVTLAVGRWGHARDVSGGLFAVMVQLFFWQTAILLFSGYGRNELTLQFPRRLFALPVHSITLALTRIVYGVVVVAITFSVLGWMATLSDDTPGLGYMCVFVAVQALLYLEASAWLLGRRPILAVGVALALWFPLAVLIKRLYEFALPLHGLGAGLLASLSVSVVFTSLAVYAVSVQRSGRTAGRPAGLGRLKSMSASAAGAILSPQRALFGFEWRRRGRWVPVFGLVSALFMGITCHMFTNHTGALFGIFLGGVSGLLAAGMFQFLVSERERASGLQRFLMTRPAPTRELARARLSALGAGYSVTFVALCLLMLGTPYLNQLKRESQTFFSPIDFIEQRVDELRKQPIPAQQLDDRPTPSEISSDSGPSDSRAPEIDVAVKYQSTSWTLVKVLTSLAFFYLLGWLCLTQPLTTLLLFYVAAVIANSGNPQSEADRWAYTAFCAFAASGLIGLTVTHLRRAFRRGLLSRRALYAVLVAWFALAYSAVYLCVRAGGTPREVLGFESSLVALALVLAVSALPLWPFATFPLSIYRHRHQ